MTHPTITDTIAELRERFYKEQCEKQDDSESFSVYENRAELVVDWFESHAYTAILEAVLRDVGEDEDIKDAIPGSQHKFLILGVNQEKSHRRFIINSALDSLKK